MLDTSRVTEYLATVRAFAERTNQWEGDQGLKRWLDYLATYAERGGKKTRAVLFKDFAPQSFHFTMYLVRDDGTEKCWFQGGLIYHGPHDNGGDGSFPTLAVSLTPVLGWSVHT